MRQVKTDTDLKNLVQRAQRAEQLLNDPMIQEFIVMVRGDLLNEFESTKLKDETERHNVWVQAQVLNRFLSKFTKSINDGKNAKQSLMERAKDVLRNVI